MKVTLEKLEGSNTEDTFTLTISVKATKKERTAFYDYKLLEEKVKQAFNSLVGNEDFNKYLVSITSKNEVGMPRYDTFQLDIPKTMAVDSIYPSLRNFVKEQYKIEDFAIINMTKLN